MEKDKLQRIPEGDVLILVERKEGEKQFHTTMASPDATAALAGISILIEEFAQLTGIPVHGVMGRLAVVLLAPAGNGTQIPQ